MHTFRSPFDVGAFFFFFFFFSTCVNNTTNNNRTPPPSANAFASGRDQNCGNVVTGRPTSRVLAPPGGTQTFTLGNDYDDLNEENNALLPSSSSSSESSSVVVVVDPLALKRMPLSELRTLCRRHSLQPAGCKDALVERLEDWMMMMKNNNNNNNNNNGVEISHVFDATRAAPGTTRGRENNNNNNYARATSQNVGNFLTERPTSRVLAPPGGASSGIF